MKKLLICCVCSILLFSCASTEPNNWMNTVYDEQYNKEDFMCALGVGYSQEKAYQEALDNISQAFLVNINSSLLLKSSNEVDTLQSVSLQTSSVDSIIGLEIVNSFYDGNQYFVRVALDKNKAIKYYTNSVLSLKRDFDNLVLEIKSVDSLITKLDKLSELDELVLKLDKNVFLLSLLSNTSYPLYYSQYSVLLNTTLKGRTYLLDFQVEDAIKESFLQYFDQELNLLGLVKTDKEPDLTITLTGSYDSALKNNQVFINYNFTAKLADKDSSLSFPMVGRVVAVDNNSAKRKLHLTIKKELQDFWEAYVK